MDVINRGFNGYNSRLGLACLPFILEEIMGPSSDICTDPLEGLPRPEAEDERPFSEPNGNRCPFRRPPTMQDAMPSRPRSSQRRGRSRAHPRYVFLIGFGANDSCLPEGAHSRYHVPLEEYASNLERMIRTILSWTGEGGATDVAVALLAPTPCDTEMQKASRNNERVTRVYADECKNVARKIGVPVVDLWRGMQLPVDREKGVDFDRDNGRHRKRDYLSDGLHLTPMGNYRLYQLVVEVLERSSRHDEIDDDSSDGEWGLGLAVTQLPRQYPDHSLVDAHNPELTFSANTYEDE